MHNYNTIDPVNTKAAVACLYVVSFVNKLIQISNTANRVCDFKARIGV